MAGAEPQGSPGCAPIVVAQFDEAQMKSRTRILAFLLIAAGASTAPPKSRPYWTERQSIRPSCCPVRRRLGRPKPVRSWN